MVTKKQIMDKLRAELTTDPNKPVKRITQKLVDSFGIQGLTREDFINSYVEAAKMPALRSAKPKKVKKPVFYKENEWSFSQPDGMVFGVVEAFEERVKNRKKYTVWRETYDRTGVKRMMYSIDGGPAEEYIGKKPVGGDEDQVEFETWIYGLDTQGYLKGFISDDGEYISASITMWMVSTVKPQRYNQNFRFGSMNCFVKQAMEQVKVLSMESKQNRIRMSKLEKMAAVFNGTDNGVPLYQIQDIAKELYANICIYNQMSEVAYYYQYSENYITLKFHVTRNDHVEKYNPSLFSLKEKDIVYVDDVQKEYDECKAPWKAYKCRDKEKKIVYFWTNEGKLYKDKKTEAFDEGDYAINSLQDLDMEKFENHEDMVNNSINKAIHPELYEFVSASQHDCLSAHFYHGDGTCKKIPKNSIKRNYYKYDKNKMYASIHTTEYYDKYMMPGSGNLELYSVNPSEFTAEDVMGLTGFARVKNVNYDNCANNTKKIFESLEYLKENNVYPTPVLAFCYDNGVTFDVDAIAFTKWTKPIRFTEEQIENKWYQKLTGVWRISCPYTKYHVHYSGDKAELMDIAAVCGDKVVPKDDNELTYFKPKGLASRCHLASFVLGYSFIILMEKMLKVNYEDLVGVFVDCITVSKNYDEVFNLTTDVTGWKCNVVNKCVDELHAFTQDKPIDLNIELPMTRCKLSYTRLSLISGGAGCGKTTRFVKKFGDSDERLSNTLYCFPTNALRADFQKKYPEIADHCYTHQLALAGGGQSHGVSLHHYSNVIMDEVSLITKKDFETAYKTCQMWKLNLIVIGDFDVEDRTVYQLKAHDGTFFLQSNFINLETCYHLHLMKNYRQGKNLEFAELLNSYRGLPTHVINSMLPSHGYRTIGVDEMVDLYEEGDQVLCAIKEECTNVNKRIFTKMPRVQIMYEDNTRKHVKNELDIIEKADYDPNTKAYKLGIACTVHVSQGQTHEDPKKVFIVYSNMWEANHAYVALSRAENKDQIYLVTDEKHEISSRVRDDNQLIPNIAKKIAAYRRSDRERNWECDLKVSDVLNMRKQQNGQCWFCKAALIFTGYSAHHPEQFSVDRIDSNKPHTASNCRLSCFRCNSYRHNETTESSAIHGPA